MDYATKKEVLRDIHMRRNDERLARLRKVAGYLMQCLTAVD